MSVIGPPVTISPTQPAILNPPQNGAGQFALCVVDNLSGYLLQVQVGAEAYYQAPLVEMAYPVISSNGAPIRVSAILLPGDTETSGVLAPTWYLAGETTPSNNWPIALSGPAEVAAATAAAIFTLGVPNVLREDEVIAAVTLPPGQTSASYPISRYSELGFFIEVQTPPQQLIAEQSDVVGNFADQEFIPFGISRWASVGAFIQFINNGASNVVIWMTGSNRTPTTRFDASTLTGDGDHWSGTATPIAGGQRLALTQFQLGVAVQGAAMGIFTHTGPGFTGAFRIILPNGNIVPICDDAEMLTGSFAGSTNRYVTKPVSLPAAGYTIEWANGGTGGTFAAGCYFIPNAPG